MSLSIYVLELINKQKGHQAAERQTVATTVISHNARTDGISRKAGGERRQIQMRGEAQDRERTHGAMTLTLGAHMLGSTSPQTLTVSLSPFYTHTQARFYFYISFSLLSH